MQYADDSPIYKHCKVNDINHSRQEIQNDINQLVNWSAKSKPVFNVRKDTCNDPDNLVP